MTETVAKPKRTRAKAPPIWCDHCNAEIMPASVRSCLRKDCKTKALLPGARRVFK